MQLHPQSYAWLSVCQPSHICLDVICMIACKAEEAMPVDLQRPACTGDWTKDLLFTRLTLCHWAVEASKFKNRADSRPTTFRLNGSISICITPLSTTKNPNWVQLCIEPFPGGHDNTDNTRQHRQHHWTTFDSTRQQTQGSTKQSRIPQDSVG